MDRKIEKKKWPPKKIITYLLSGLFIFLIIYNLLFGDTSSKLNVETEKITISIVEKGPFQEFIPITGNVIPITTVYISAIEGGQVKTRFLEAGTMVKKGDKLMELENTDLLMNIMFREAELFDQSNNLRNTRLAMEQNQLNLKSQLIDLDYQIQRLNRDYIRNEKLVKENLISAQEYERIKDEYDYNLKRKALAIQSYKQDSLFRKIQIGQLEASLMRMQNNLDLVKTKLENLIVRTPISGNLTALNAEIGESISQGQRLGQVDDLNGFKVKAGIDEHYLPRVSAGLSGEFDLSGETYKLSIRKVFPEIRDGRFDVDLEFDEEPRGIRRGQTLHIRLALGDLSEAILLARGGFYQRTGGQWVYVLDEDGSVAVKRSIKLGRQNTRVFEVLEGLEPGEKVVTSSYDTFGDNDKLVFE